MSGKSLRMWTSLMGWALGSRVCMVMPISKEPQPVSETWKGGEVISAREGACA